MKTNVALTLEEIETIMFGLLDMRKNFKTFGNVHLNTLIQKISDKADTLELKELNQNK